MEVILLLLVTHTLTSAKAVMNETQHGGAARSFQMTGLGNLRRCNRVFESMSRLEQEAQWNRSE